MLIITTVALLGSETTRTICFNNKTPLIYQLRNYFQDTLRHYRQPAGSNNNKYYTTVKTSSIPAFALFEKNENRKKKNNEKFGPVYASAQGVVLLQGEHV